MKSPPSLRHNDIITPEKNNNSLESAGRVRGLICSSNPLIGISLLGSCTHLCVSTHSCLEFSMRLAPESETSVW